ncbi:MAG: discoidin domain-containing protein [Myxococcaceae bacterium]|nr:discoidin domain-containing protein [Myxococcaceae bacterium]
MKRWLPWCVVALTACEPLSTEEPSTDPDLVELDTAQSALSPSLELASATATTSDANVPANAIDRDTATRWSGEGDGAALTITLRHLSLVDAVELAWYNGSTRTATFDLLTSVDGASYAPQLTRVQSQRLAGYELSAVGPVQAQYVRIVGHGNTRNDWNSIREVRVRGAVVAGADAGAAPDAGVAPDAGATPDAGAPRDGGSSGPRAGLWLSPAEVMALPMSGSAWAAVEGAARGAWGSADLSDLNSRHDVNVLAGALVAVRTGDGALLAKTVAGIDAVRGSGYSRVLELSRNIQGYVFAADLIDLGRVAPSTDATFRIFLAGLPNLPLQGHSGGVDLESTARLSPNNWGCHARAALAAIQLYLGQRSVASAGVATWLRGWEGDRAAYSGFDGEYTNSGWHFDFSQPVGINPKGATRNGRDFDGLLPEDQRRAGNFTWPAPKEGYTWEALQGTVVAAVVLDRAGLLPLTASDSAVLRAVQWHYRPNFTGGTTFPAEGDDTWIPWVVNKVYGVSLPTSPASSGKNMGWTDWTHR